jgi:SAM-dependent methyltransferase
MEMLEFFLEIHKDIPREGPGSHDSTLRALEAVKPLPEKPRILDVGCGPGQQSIWLVQETGGTVVCVDNHQYFLDDLARRAVRAGVSDRIQPINVSMFEMEFMDESFDLIWSEGAIYVIGLGEGITAWKRFLKPDCCLAASHITWLKDNPPLEPLNYWNEAYPAITDIQTNLMVIKEAGYKLVDNFTLPESDWLEEYYAPLKTRVDRLREQHPNEPDAITLLDAEDYERELYRRYSDWFGYEFYIMRK